MVARFQQIHKASQGNFKNISFLYTDAGQLSYKSVRPSLQNVSCLNGRIFTVSATINIQEEILFIIGGIQNAKGFKKAAWENVRLAYDCISDCRDRAGRSCYVCCIRAVVGLRQGIA